MIEDDDTPPPDAPLPTRAFARKVTPSPPPPPDEPPAWRRWLGGGSFGLVLLAFAIGWSFWRVAVLHFKRSAPGQTVVRIAHWQLESGYREAMQAVIDDYNKLHAERKIVIEQVPVTEKVYAQWLNVNLIADNAPDIAELGMSSFASSADAVAKYFIPLGREVMAPNPYNAEQYLDELEVRDPHTIDTLEHASWRDTLTDGMRGGYRQDLQDYYSIPTTFFTQRMFYNRDLFREALGSDEPPHSLGQLFAFSERIREWAKSKGRVIDPIAGTRYHRAVFVWTNRITFTNAYQYPLDVDYSGDIAGIETVAGFQQGKISYRDQCMRDYYEVVRKICTLFNPNFAAMDRDQAIAAFASGSSAMMATGSWDGNSIFSSCKFDVGVMPFPLPAPGEPYSRSGTLPFSEATSAGGSGFGVARSSKHAEIALDFLRFLTSHKWNQKLNRLNGWLPIAVGTTPAKRMLPFMPNPYGVSGDIGFRDSGNIESVIGGKEDLFLAGEIAYDDFAKTIETALADPNIGYENIWRKNVEKTTDNLNSLERTIAVQSSRQLMGKGDGETAAKIRETVLDQALGNNGANLRHRYRGIAGHPLVEEP
jgi:ABC-type glycerol-3-phosphate transport system substrate-binding protein